MATGRGRRISVDGHTFKNEIDYRKYLGVRQLVSDGRLTGLEIYPKFPLVVRGSRVDVFEATFKFHDDRKREWRVVLVGASVSKAIQMKVHLFETLYEMPVERWA